MDLQHGHQAFALTPEAGPGVVDGLRAERRKQQTIGDQHLERYSLDRARCQVVSLSKSYNRFVELWNEWKAENDLVDFEDMITLAWERGVSPVHSPAVIYGDEAQDWSASEIRLLLSWARSARAGACLVGDGDQAIYAWRGADHHAFLGIRAPEENRKVLSQSYRVPRAVRDFALEYIRSTVAQREDVEYLARDADGFVDRYSGWAIHGQGLWRLANHLEDETRAGGRTHMILAYGNTQLATLLKELRARGVPFANRFRAANKAWNPLERVHARAFASGFARQDALGRPSWTRGEVAKWIEVVDSQHLQRGAKAYLKGLAKSQKKGDGTAERQFPPTLLYGEGEGDDTIPIWAPGVRFDPTFEWLFEHTMASALNHVAYHAVVERRFGREHLDAEPKITVGTIHSVKGGEADVVYVSPDLPYPAVADRMVDRRRADESIGRLYYVAFTRAREGLVLLEPRRRARSIELAF